MKNRSINNVYEYYIVATESLNSKVLVKSFFNFKEKYVGKYLEF